MRSIALALGASLTWGFADFFGPLKGRTLGALRVLVYVPTRRPRRDRRDRRDPRQRALPTSAVLFAIPAAISGTLGLYAYYRGMAVGAMSIVAPIAGISAGGTGRSSGSRPATGPRPGSGSGSPRRSAASSWRHASPVAAGRVAAGVGLALLAAIGFGGYFPPMHEAGNADFWWASLIFRMTSTSIILAAVAIRRPSLARRADQVACAGTDRDRRHARQPPLRGSVDERARQHHVGAGVALSDRHGRCWRASSSKERVARSQEAGIALTTCRRRRSFQPAQQRFSVRAAAQRRGARSRRGILRTVSTSGPRGLPRCPSQM